MGKSELSLKARRLLRIMNRMKNDVTTRDLTRETGLPNYDVGHHMGRLDREGFVECTGEKDVGAPNDAKVYAITESGEYHAEEVLAEIKETATVEGVDNQAVHELREEVGQLWEANDTTLDKLDSANERIEGLDDQIRSVKNSLELHRNVIKNLKEKDDDSP